MKKILSFLMLTLLTAGFSAKAEDQIYAVWDNSTTTLTLYYDDQREAQGGVTKWWFNSIMPTATTVALDESMKAARPTSTANWFYLFDKLTEIRNLDYLNTSEVTNMEEMFYNCKALTSLDFSTFNTEKVTKMNGMFHGCESLTSLDLNSFNTDNVNDINEMFGYCSALTTIYWDVDLSERIGLLSTNMFRSCTSLKGGNGTEFNSGKTDASYARPDGVDDKAGYFTSSHDFGVKSEMYAILQDLHALYDFAVQYVPEDELTDIKGGIDNFDNIYNTETVAKIESNLALARMLRSTAINKLMTDGIDALKFLLNDKLMLGDNPACTDIISDAQGKVDALTWDDLKSVTENLAIIAPAVKKIIDDTDEALFADRTQGVEAQKAELNGYIQDLKQLYDFAKQYFAETELADMKSSIEFYEATYNNPKATTFMVYTDNMSASMTHNDAINMLMVEGKAAIKAVLDGLLQTGDNAACEDIINDAKNEVDYFSWDYNKTVEENLTDLETAVNDIITRAKAALATARTTTGNEEVEDQDNSQKSKAGSLKVIRNGQLLIIRGGKTYNAVGAEVQ